jgi:hypothetical protein
MASDSLDIRRIVDLHYNTSLLSCLVGRGTITIHSDHDEFPVLQISMYHAWHVFEALKHGRTDPTLASSPILVINARHTAMRVHAVLVPLRCRCAVLLCQKLEVSFRCFRSRCIMHGTSLRLSNMCVPIPPWHRCQC